MPKAKLTVSLTFQGTNVNDDDGNMHLNIQDQVSGVVLTDVLIPVGRFMALMQGGTHDYDGFISKDLDYVGMQRRHSALKVPRDVTGYGHDAIEENKAVTWLQQNKPAEVPSDARLEQRAQNDGWLGIWRWWADD